MQRIFRLLLVLSAIVIGAFWFVHWSRTRALNSGAVHFRPQPTENAKSSTPPQTATQTDSAPPENSSQPEVASNSGEPSRPGPALPASDSLRRQPPNGITAAGTGKFELYRQGDLTFRLNTQTGDACVLFATQSEWSKTNVYSHGCAGH